MKFIVSRTPENFDDGKKIEDVNCDEAITCDGLTLVEESGWDMQITKTCDRGFFLQGENHRDEPLKSPNRRGETARCVRDITNQKAMVVEVETLEDLVAFIKKHGQIVVMESSFKEIPFEIEIYSELREYCDY